MQVCRRWLLRPRTSIGTVFVAVVLLLGSVGLIGWLIGASALASATSGPSCSAGKCTVSYGFTGSEQTFVVPDGVSSLTLAAVGAAGQASLGNPNDPLSAPPQAGGLGGTASTSGVPVVAGQRWYIEVGGQGSASTLGFNGGGQGGVVVNGSVPGAGGGGASDVQSCPRSTCRLVGNSVLVAAGGGGGATYRPGGNAGSGARGNLSDSFGGGGDPGQPGQSGGSLSPGGAAGSGGGGGGADDVGQGGGAGGPDGGGGGGGGVTVGLSGGGGGAGGSNGAAGGAGANGGGSGGAAGIGGNAYPGGGGGGGGGGLYGGGAGGSDFPTAPGGGGGGGGSSYCGAGSCAAFGTTTNPASVTVSYADPITATPPHYSVTANQKLVVTAANGVLSQAAVTGPTGDALAVSLTRGPSHGTIALSSDGSFTYTPTAEFVGADSFAYTVTDTSSAGGGDYLTVTAPVTVSAGRPGAPVPPSATAGAGQATVTFSAPADDGGAAVTGYTVTASPGAIQVSATSSPATVTGLTPGATYTFTVAATNSQGTGPASAPSNAVTIPSSTTIDTTSSSTTTGAPSPPTPPAASTPAAAPAITAAPAIAGTAAHGKVLTCETGAWTGDPTGYTYQWSRDGTPIASATSATYTVQPIDEGEMLTCAVVARNQAGAGWVASSQTLTIPVPRVKGCPAAAGTASGTRLGAIKLGMSRDQARAALRHSTRQAHGNADSFCLTPFGINVGYPSGKLLATLPAPTRHRDQNSVVWITTANAHYKIAGVRSGVTLAAVEPRVKLGKPIVEHGTDWYLVPDGPVTALVKVHAGIIQEIGITTSALAKGRSTRDALLGTVS